MRKIFTRVMITAAIIGMAITGTAMALAQSASAHTNYISQLVAVQVNRSFTQQLRSRMSLAGFHVGAVSTKCAPAYNGVSGGYVCRTTFIVMGEGHKLQYATMINASNTGFTWHQQGSPWMIHTFY